MDNLIRCIKVNFGNVIWETGGFFMENKSGGLSLARVLLEGIEEMVFIVRVEEEAWVYECINEAVKTHTQITDSAIGKTFFEVHDKPVADGLIRYYEKARSSGTSIFYEDSYYAPNGELRYSKSRLTPMYDDSGKCSHVVSVVNDVTQEKLAKLAREEALRRLEESNAKYRSLFESNGDAVLTLTLQGKLNGGNQRARLLVKWPMSELAGADFSALIDADDVGRAQLMFEEAIAGTYNDHRLHLKSKEGDKIACLMKLIPITVQHKVTGFYLMAKDMTELDALVSKYLESERNFRVMAENVYDVIVLMNRQKQYLYVSPSSTEIFGISPEEVGSRQPFFNVHPEDLPLVDEQFQLAVQEARPYSLQLRIDHQHRGWIWTEMNGTPVYDQDGAFSHMVMIVRDISVQKKHEQQLEYYAFHDVLTGLPNRRYFQEYSSAKLTERAKSESAIALAVLDLDDFKKINDEYGHEAGDEVLKLFAERLSSLERAEFMPARMGGDEFVVLLENVKTHCQAEQAVEQIQRALAGNWKIGEALVAVDFSIGVAVASASGETVSSILKQADKAMYKQKGLEQSEIGILQP